MAKKIEIEYCGGWGWGGTATRLKKAVQQAFAGVDIDCHSANGWTGKVVVSWVDGANKKHVWDGGRDATDSGHATVINALKSTQWVTSKERTQIIKCRGAFKNLELP